LVNIPCTGTSTKMWLLQSKKICFHWFGVKSYTLFYPPSISAIKLPQTHPHNRHTFSIARYGWYSPVEITRPTIWWKPKRWQSSELEEQLIHYELRHVAHLSATLDILQQSIPSTAFP
jgi:hypothetical protein